MSEKICIVDDNLVNRKLLAAILEREGYELLEATDGEEAIEVAWEKSPDLILLDVTMPKKDGYQVCEELKRDERTAHIPIIFLSANSQVEDKIKGLDLGAADYVTKPFDRGEVLARVRTHLNVARLTKEIMGANRELLNTQRRLEEDLQAAAGIQRSLLPRETPNMENVAVAWRFMPCERIGGDIFNVVQLDDNQWSIYMLDVSGHGVPSALVTVSVSQMLHPSGGLLIQRATSSCPQHDVRSPAEVLRLLDREYPMERFNKYFTITYLILDVKNGVVRYSNAAHPPPLLLRKDGRLEVLEEGGTIIGLGGLLPFEEGEKRIDPGDKLFIYTDGIPEYENKRGQLYGQERFVEILQQLRERPIAELVDGVIDALMAYGDHHPPRDDVTLLGIEMKYKMR